MFLCFADFKVAVYRLSLAAGEQGLNLPPYKGSTIRGGFGHVFRRIACSQPKCECRDCMLAQTCPYALIFEPAPPPGSAVLKHYSDIPRPFVIEPPLETKTNYTPGETLEFGLVLIGQAIQYLPYFVLAFKELGNVGLGKGRLPFTLADVAAVDAASGQARSIYNSGSNRITPVQCQRTLAELQSNCPSGDILTLDFLTMTRLKYEHSLVLEIPFHVLVRNLLRRISTLYYFYHGYETADIDYKGLVERATDVPTLAQELKLVDWERYSHRKDVKMNMGGLVGRVAYGDGWQEFSPLIRLGEIVHVGKGCVFGLGQYVIGE
ncbi:hypothetical protein SCACP_39150 [Sporomusa carbonis]|uniref:CRISPR system precrRNA processing endoribonuclease RAMP protein Cas6 n=1 Tax=Sporomusa carbonis TaxID=3076075 RepID=UPI003A7A8B2F